MDDRRVFVERKVFERRPEVAVEQAAGSEVAVEIV
jgi:hypothetical protein